MPRLRRHFWGNFKSGEHNEYLGVPLRRNGINEVDMLPPLIYVCSTSVNTPNLPYYVRLPYYVDNESRYRPRTTREFLIIDNDYTLLSSNNKS